MSRWDGPEALWTSVNAQLVYSLANLPPAAPDAATARPGRGIVEHPLVWPPKEK